MAEETDPLSSCHSCGQQTLTNLQILTSQWRLVLLCNPCLHLILSAVTCSYCFSPISLLPSLTCLHCSSRVHVTCIPCHRRHPSDPDPNSFSCVDCSPLFSFSRLCLEKLVANAKIKQITAARAKENATDKVRIAITAGNKARNAILALARPVGNAGTGISRRERVCENVELCGEDKEFFDDWVEEEKRDEGLLKYQRRRDRLGNCGSMLKYYQQRVKLKNGGEDTLGPYLKKSGRKSGLKAMLKREENRLASC